MERASDPAGWRFDNSYARLPAALFSRVMPQPVRRPALALLNGGLAVELGLEPQALAGDDGAAIFAGNTVPAGAEPIAQAYAGHQFGHFVTLGDGRAILLGEQLTPAGGRVDIQLKGAGRTPYSRGGDGRAALGPMLREHVIGEAMHALGIPTTRSLAVATTGEAVLRGEPLAGAVLVRVAASHIRVGTFQYAAAVGDPAVLEALLHHAILRHDPERADADEPAVAFFDAVVGRQARLVARWLLVGFVHGVMNTDNMAVSGETIDYGPCAFLDAYDPATVFSSIDRQGRYAYGSQPGIAHWNLARLAESLLPAVRADGEAALDAMRDVFATFPARFEEAFTAGLRDKLGLLTAEEEDAALGRRLLDCMQEVRADFTGTFAALADVAEAGATAVAPIDSAAFHDWRQAWLARLGRQSLPIADATAVMRRSNPLVIPRNHRVEEALTAAQAGDILPFERLVAAVQRPFTTTADTDPYRQPPPAACGPYRTFCGT
jgi:uncharacterized protein YdiU (UPF0061 family)